MKPLFIEYPKCSTCQKAKKQLLSQGCLFDDRHIIEQTPTKEELAEWLKRSEMPIQKFFNTSGNLYKEMKLKEKLPSMSEEEKLSLLCQHGMLIKRPLYIDDKRIIIGYKEEIYREIK